MVSAPALRSGDPDLKKWSDHYLNFILVVPGLTSLMQLKIANWFALKFYSVRSLHDLF